MNETTLSADLIVRDVNGNTIARAELPGLPYEEFDLIETHVANNGTVIMTVELTDQPL